MVISVQCGHNLCTRQWGRCNYIMANLDMSLIFPGRERKGGGRKHAGDISVDGESKLHTILSLPKLFKGKNNHNVATFILDYTGTYTLSSRDSTL